MLRHGIWIKIESEPAVWYVSSQEQEVATDEVKTAIEVNVKVAAEVMVKIVIQVVEKM